jgi:hypothetical protein
MKPFAEKRSIREIETLLWLCNNPPFETNLGINVCAKAITIGVL